MASRAHETALQAGYRHDQALVDGRYRIIRELGRGASGVVYLAHDRLRQRDLVLKHLWPQGDNATSTADETKESFRLLTRLHHPGLPRLLDWGEDSDGRIYYTKEYSSGQPGDQLAGELSAVETATVAYILTETLLALHRAGYCHGDLKPDNLLVERTEGAQPRATLIDFGLIFETLDRSAGIRGTARYIAPELLAGNGTASPDTDLYSLGATLYHLHYGRPAFGGGGRTRTSVSDAALIDRIINEEPAHPPEGVTLETDLDKLLAKLVEALMSRDPASRAEAARGLLTSLSKWAPTDLGAASQFVGREQTLAQLEAWYTEQTEARGASRVCLLAGVAGAGKRRLAGVFAEPVRSAGATVLEYDTVGAEFDLTLSQLARQLLIQAPELVARPADLLGELSDEVDLSDAVSNPSAQRLLDHLAEAAQRSPILIIVHATRPSATTGSLQAVCNYLAAVSEEQTRPRLSVLTTVNTDTEGAEELLAALHSGLTLEIRGLPFEDSTRFFEANMSTAVDAETARVAHELTQGLPAGLERVAGAIGRARASGRKVDRGLIETVADTRGWTQKALEQLSEAAREVVTILAKVDAPMELEALRACSTKRVNAGTLEVLRAAELVRSIGPTQWVVSGPHVRDAVPAFDADDRDLAARYSRHLERRVEDGSVPPLHRLTWLQRAGEVGTVVPLALEIGEAFTANGSMEQAIRAFGIALEAALQLVDAQGVEAASMGLLRLHVLRENASDANRVGQHLLEHWLADGDDAGIRKFVSDPLEEETDWGEVIARVPAAAVAASRNLRAEAMALLTDAARVAGNTVLLGHRLLHTAEQLAVRGDARAWRPFFRSATRLLYRGSHRPALRDALVACVESPVAEELDPGERAELLNLLGVLTERDDREQASAHYERCMMAGIAGGRLLPAALKGLGNLLRIVAMRGEFQVARYYAERWLNLAQASGLITTHNILRNLALAYDHAGRPYLAFQTFEQAFRMAVRSGNVEAQGVLNVSRLGMHYRFGLTKQALQLAARSHESASADRRWLVPLQLTYAHLLHHELKAAKTTLVEAAEEISKLPEDNVREANLSLCAAKVALLEGNHHDAVRRAGLAVVKSRNLYVPTTVEALITLLEGELALGEYDEADVRLGELDTLIQKHHLERERPVALHLRARLERERGAHDRATQLFQRAHDRLEEQLAGTPRAYREGYLSAAHLHAIVEDATSFDSSARGHLIDGMRRILKITNSLQRASNQRLVSVLDEVLDQIIEFTDAERGILFRVESLGEDQEAGPDASVIVQDWGSKVREERWTVEIAHARGFGEKDLDKKRTQASGTVLRRVMEKAAPVLSADAIEDMRFSQSGSIATLGMRSILAFPLDVDGEPRGIVYLDSPHGQQFSESDKQLLTLLGNQLGPVVEAAYQREASHVVNAAFPRIVGTSRELTTVLEKALKIAHANIPVLVLGETGTGKELLARGVHESSPRSRRPFVPINCASLPESLVEAELFGAERGAYTGAHQARPGYFEQANTGTIFLDEIGDLPLPAQASLLRVLQEGMVRRVGSDKDREVDVRVVAATHWDLEDLVAKGEFRQDLFYRLNVMQLRLPPLRERPEDIPALVQFYFRLFVESHNLNLPAPAGHLVSALQSQPWPGNIRQLRNAMERAMLLCNGGELTLDTLLSAAGDPTPPSVPKAQTWGQPGWGQPQAPPQAQPPWYGQQAPGWQAPPGYRQPGGDSPSMYPPQPPSWAQGAPPAPPGWGPPPGWSPHGQAQAPSGPWAPSGSPQPGAWAPQGYGPPPWAWGPPPWAQAWNPWGWPAPGAPAPEAPAKPAPQTVEAPSSKDEYQRKQAEYRYQMAMDALEQAGGNKKKAAQIMGISRRGFYRILEQFRKYPAPPPEPPIDGST